MSSADETLRWPTRLDHHAIVRRLVDIRRAAHASGLAELSARFRDVETMLATSIALNVVGALTDPLVDERHRPLVRQLEMVAMNLKNLRNDGPSTR
jgi:hypothetical protein